MADSVEDIIKRGRERQAQYETEAAAAEQAVAGPEDASTLERVLGPKSTAGGVIRGFGKGASFGGIDELAGLISSGNTLAAKAYGKALGLSQDDIDELIYTRTGIAPGSAETPYEAGKRQSLEEYEQARAASPIATGLGEFAGGIMGGMALGPMLRGLSALRSARGAAGAASAARTASASGVGAAAARQAAAEAAAPVASAAESAAAAGAPVVESAFGAGRQAARVAGQEAAAIPEAFPIAGEVVERGASTAARLAPSAAEGEVIIPRLMAPGLPSGQQAARLLPETIAMEGEVLGRAGRAARLAPSTAEGEVILPRLAAPGLPSGRAARLIGPGAAEGEVLMPRAAQRFGPGMVEGEATVLRPEFAGPAGAGLPPPASALGPAAPSAAAPIGGSALASMASRLASTRAAPAAEAAAETASTAAPQIPGLTERLLGLGKRGMEFAAREGKQALPAAALTAALSSEAPLREGDIKGFAGETLLGTAEGTLGSVLGAGALKGAGKAAKAGAETLEEWGLKNLLKAVSPNAQIADKLKQNKIKTPEDIRRFQKDIRRLGVVGPFSNAEDILERVNVKRELEGPVIGKAIETADERALSGQARYRPSRDLQRQAINREIAQESASDELKAEALETAFSPISRTLKSDEQMASVGNPTTFEHLWKMKDTIRKMAQPKQASTDLSSEAFRDIEDAYNKSFYRQLEDALPQGMAQQVKSSAYDYAQLSTVRKLAEEAARRQALHKSMSLSDIAKGAMAAQASGNPLLALPAIAGSIITKNRMPAMTAAAEFAGQSALEAGAKGAEFAAPYVRAAITSTSGPEGGYAKDNAYQRLERRLGRKVRSDDELASKHFLDGQNNPEAQPSRR